MTTEAVSRMLLALPRAGAAAMPPVKHVTRALMGPWRHKQLKRRHL
jgi:hypothetical protein